MSDLMSTPAAIDDESVVDRLLRANLTEVFGQRDAGRRLAAIQRLYAPDAVLHEPDRSVTGHAAIDQAVSDLLATLPADFAFQAQGRAQGHHGLAVLRWRAVSGAGPEPISGMDVARIDSGRIQSLHVLLNPSESL